MRLIPFKDHINIEAKTLVKYKDELADYKMTPKGMLQIFVNQEIPEELLWYGTNYKVDAEANNGLGQVDFIVSKGNKNQNIIEFKLAKNSGLPNVFKQVKIYENANVAEGSLIVIFYFTESECIRAKKVIEEAGYTELIGESIYLVDCRKDNKISASKV